MVEKRKRRKERTNEECPLPARISFGEYKTSKKSKSTLDWQLAWRHGPIKDTTVNIPHKRGDTRVNC